MRRENKKDIEKEENMLRSVKPPELADEEIESYKEDINRVLLEKFSDITLQRERRHVLRVKLAYGLAIFTLIFTLSSFMYVKPYLIRVATARIISEQLKIKVTLKDVITKDGFGIVIYSNEEYAVNLQDEKIQILQPIPYRPSEEDKEKAVEIVRNSKETKSFVTKEGEAPQDISNNPVLSVEGLMFPNSGKKMIEVCIAYTPKRYPPYGMLPMTTAKFTVDIEKGEIEP